MVFTSSSCRPSVSRLRACSPKGYLHPSVARNMRRRVCFDSTTVIMHYIGFCTILSKSNTTKDRVRVRLAPSFSNTGMRPVVVLVMNRIVREPVGPTDTQKILDFLSLESNASRSFRADLDVASRAAICTQQIGARSAYQVWMEVSSGSAESCLELGLRSVLSSCFLSLIDPCLDCSLAVVLPRTRTPL